MTATESTQNRVTIFSNGIADFRRGFKTSGKEKISIPVKKDHIGDVLASLNVYGSVKLTTPPSFTPQNEISGKLELDSSSIELDLGRKLVGAQVTIAKNGGEIKGKLMGLSVEERSTGGEATRDYSYCVLTSGGGVERIKLTQVQKLTFDEEQVKDEIQKSLQRSFESIRPHATHVNLEVEPQEEGKETTFNIHYTLPAAAWKTSYRIRRPTDGAAMLFDAFAIVDNNTEEDWKEATIAVVTGQPITFSTDLADSKTPSRSKINVVADFAAGAVEPEAGYSAKAMRRSVRTMSGGMQTKSTNMLLESDVDCEAGERSESIMLAACAAPQDFEEEAAFTADTEVREVGDFSIFESSSPMNIGAGESATFPICNTTLEDASSILYYDARRGEERAYRAIRFKNETDQSLGRGVCTVIEKGTYSGSCVVPNCKPGEVNMLPHAVETGVRIRREVTPTDATLSSIKISDGIVVTQYRQAAQIDYRISNSKDEDFNLSIDHYFAFGKGTEASCKLQRGEETTELVESELLKNGKRFAFQLLKNENVVVTVKETFLDSQRITFNTNWVQTAIISSKHPLTEDKELATCIELQQELDELQREYQKEQRRANTAESKQERVIQLLESDKDNADWKKDLSESETTIREVQEKKLPALQDKKEELQQKLQSALSAVTTQWSEAK